jgi:PAS domain S-box-containing protein
LGLSFRRKSSWIFSAAFATAVLAIVVWQTARRRSVPDRLYRIGWELDAPFQTTGSDGQPKGLAIDVVREAARRRGIRLQWIHKPEGGEAALRGQTVDLWPFLTVTPERTKILHISEPFLETEHCLLVPAASSFQCVRDLAHATVSLHGMPMTHKWRHTVLPEARPLAVATTGDAVSQVCKGNADAAFLDEYTAIQAFLSGGSCADVPLRWINVPGSVARLGIGSTFANSLAADAIRDEIGVMAAEGTMQNTLGQWGYMSGLHLKIFQELWNARQREMRLELGIALFALLAAMASWLALRAHRERDRAQRAERSQRGTEERLRLLAANLTQMVLAYDMDRKLTYANPAVQTLIGYSPEELASTHFIDGIHSEDRERMLALWDDLYQGKSFREVEYRLIAKDGTVKWVSATWGPIHDASGQQVGVQGGGQDITERKLAEEALRESERRFRGMLENVHLSALMLDLDGTITFCNDYVVSATGWAREELVGHPVTSFLLPEDRERVAGLIQSIKTDAGPSHWTAEPGILAKSGRVLRFRASTVVLRDAQGKPTGLANIGVDITEQHALQQQYLQSQKMEGLGRLAGGVAHDFNNLLTVINGYSDIVFRKLEERDPLRPKVDQVRKAGARGADLTRQLLTFSRKQVSQPKPLDLNLVVADCQEMWGRLLGEEIQLVIRLSSVIGQVMADAGQIHQVLMNLVVNARDAMPDGGTLVIETSNLEVDASYVAANREAVEGPHVLLAVSDTGVGMDEDIRRQVFEPFFTTKPVGEGSGLGLATVFGIVKQSKGWIDVYSEPGAGSTFKVYLPRIQALESAAETVAPLCSTTPCSETILLVEDQEEVRSLAKNVLEEQGYSVLSACSANAALELAEHYSGSIDLLLTDVVLPGMSSRELAGRLIVKRPQMRVLFTSGYTQEAAALRTVLDQRTAFLPKPYLPDVMAARVRGLLDSPAQG